MNELFSSNGMERPSKELKNMTYGSKTKLQEYERIRKL